MSTSPSSIPTTSIAVDIESLNPRIRWRIADEKGSRRLWHAKFRQKKVAEVNLGGYWSGLHEEKEEEYEYEEEDEENLLDDGFCQISDLQEAKSDLPKLRLMSHHGCMHGFSHGIGVRKHDIRAQKHTRRMESYQNNRMKAEVDKIGLSGMEVVQQPSIHEQVMKSWKSTGQQTYKIVATIEESQAYSI